MKQYHDLLGQVLRYGGWQDNRTGIRTLRIDGHMMQFRMSDGFPAITTKKLAFNSVKGELLGFIEGASSAARFRELGCKVWDQNANENVDWLSNPYRDCEDHLGRIYGVQWREWRGPDGLTYDQLDNAVHAVMNSPTSRRIVVSAWNPAELDQMALPPCHMVFQLLVNVDQRELSLLMTQRSCDVFLGLPFNIASYALLLHLIAGATDLKPGKLTMFLSDVHIYENHIDQVNEQLSREPYTLPELAIPKAGCEGLGVGMQYLTKVRPDDIQLLGYVSHPPISAPMAV